MEVHIMAELTKTAYTITEAKANLSKIVENLVDNKPVILYNAKENQIVAEISKPQTKKKNISFGILASPDFVPSSDDDIMSPEFDEEVIADGEWL
jgi:hypothetical protein